MRLCVILFVDFRYNDFQNDPEAQVQGCDQPTPAGSLANRMDLGDPDSPCNFVDHDHMGTVHVLINVS